MPPRLQYYYSTLNKDKSLICIIPNILCAFIDIHVFMHVIFYLKK